jgi:hypothetical protein
MVNVSFRDAWKSSALFVERAARLQRAFLEKIHLAERDAACLSGPIHPAAA